VGDLVESGRVVGHISLARKDMERVRVDFCPTCKRRRQFYCWFQEWYGWHETCTGCGDAWTDGEMHERPFQRGWRQKAIAGAKESIRAMREPNGTTERGESG